MLHSLRDMHAAHRLVSPCRPLGDSATLLHVACCPVTFHLARFDADMKVNKATSFEK